MQLYVEEHGAADAPAVVLLHGGGLSGRMWQPQIERLAGYHCVVPDLPEQGRSAAIGHFDLDDSARRVAALIRERCRDRRAHVVGLSLGGAVALTLLRVAPEAVGRVVVSGTAAGLGRVLGAVSIASAGLYRYIPRETLVRTSIRQFGIPPAYHSLVHDDLLRSTNATFTRHVTRALMALRLPGSAIQPVLVAVGARETVIARRAARRLVAALPQARGVIAPDVGHVWNLEAPDLFSDMLLAWLQDRPLPATLRPIT